VREVARQNLGKARKKPRGNVTKKEFRHGMERMEIGGEADW
jgi:hypothetical protein